MSVKYTFKILKVVKHIVNAAAFAMCFFVQNTDFCMEFVQNKAMTRKVVIFVLTNKVVNGIVGLTRKVVKYSNDVD